jgi:hypothetical protein
MEEEGGGWMGVYMCDATWLVEARRQVVRGRTEGGREGGRARQGKQQSIDITSSFVLPGGWGVGQSKRCPAFMSHCPPLHPA